jgi:hypothetical protein
MRNFNRPAAVAAIAITAVLSSLALATPSSARNTPGDLTLTVSGKCTNLGDSIQRFEVWTPEKGGRTITAGKSGTINFGTINKKEWGDTFFNWTLDCKLGGTSGSHQKRYGGAPFATNFSFNIENFSGRLTKP